MPTYNFKEEAEVYVVTGGNQYRIHVTDITFSQTFSEESYPVTTIHSPNDFFEASVINKANAATFSITLPAIEESNYLILHSLLLGPTAFDLYVKTPADVYRLRQSVMTNGSFVIERSRPLRLEITGEASQLYRAVTGFTGSSTIINRTPIIPIVDVSISNSPLDNVVGVTMELQNEITWNPFRTVNGAFSATPMYPSEFTISKKILAGSITQYLTDSNKATAQTFSTGTALSIKAGNGLSGLAFRGFSFGPATCSYTNRIATGAIYTQGYDWRLTQNTDLATILKYETD